MFNDIFSPSVRMESLGFGALIPENTVRRMIDIINISAKNIRVRNFAAELVKNTRQKDQWSEAEAIFHWIQDHSRYVRDPQGTEMIQTPLVALDYFNRSLVWQGDCDDYTVLLLSLYKSIGYPVAIRTVSYYQHKRPGHVYGLMRIYDNWYPVDGIKQGVWVGWEKEGATYVKDYKI